MSLGIERRGYLSNVFTGAREYIRLRAGVLRIRQTPKGKDTSIVFLGFKCIVTLQAHGVIGITSTVPYAQEYLLSAPSESEAEIWYDDLQASIKEEQTTINGYRELLEGGCSMSKYNYSNSKRSRRYFWVADSGKELCWSRAKGSSEEAQKVSLSECVGITYGPITTTFQRLQDQLQDPTWSCFSLLFMGRTLDLAVCGDVQVQAWFAGLQNLISCFGVGSMPPMSDTEFVVRKVQLKLLSAAHRAGYTFRRFLILRVRHAAATQGLAGLGKGALLSGGALCKGLFAPSTTSTCRVESSADVRMHGCESEVVAVDDPESVLRTTLHNRILTLQSQIRDTSMRMRAARHAMRISETLPAPPRTPGGAPMWRTNIVTALDEAAKEELRNRASLLEWEALDLGDVNDRVGPQAKATEKHGRSIKKIEGKLQASQTRLAQLERELATARASMEVSTTEKSSSSTAEACAKSRCEELQGRVQELEQRLQANVSLNQEAADAEAKLNREQATLIAGKRQEQLLRQQDVETFERDSANIREKELGSSTELARASEMRCKLVGLLQNAPQVVARLREEQDRMRASLFEIGNNFGSEVSKAGEVTSRMSARYNEIGTRCKELHIQRKDLHNLVLQLKGNIRVFVRPRAMSKDELAADIQGGQPTLEFAQDTRIGLYDADTKRRKWFDFELIFRTVASQAQVLEETQAFASSTLDGYNSCVFAYGQKASGKTHTVVGSSQDPGLSTRMVENILKLRQERCEEYNVQVFLSCVEVGEKATIRDLLSGGSTELEIRSEKDASWSGLGLAEMPIACKEDAAQYLDDAINVRNKDEAMVAHFVVTISTESSLRSGGESFRGKLHLIDLASSDATGPGFEARQQSLGALSDVMIALASKSPQVPFKSSTLTMVLRESLAGDSKAVMIVHLPVTQPTTRSDSLMSLTFGSKLRTAANIEDKPAKDKSRR